MQKKQDFFTLLRLFGGAASRYDWLNHCAGAERLMQDKNSPLFNTGFASSLVRSRDNAGYGWDVLEEDDGSFELYDENNPAFSLHLAWQEVNCWALHPLHFAEWVQKILGLSGKIKPRLLHESRLLMWPVEKEEVYLYIGTSVQELREIMKDISGQRQAVTLLFLTDWWRTSAALYEEICSFPFLSPFSMQELVRYEEGNYVYGHAVPFLQLIKSHDEALPEAELLPRPAGAQWHHLHIQIRTASHHEYMNVAQDVLIAWYEDDKGKRMGSRAERRLSTLTRLCRNHKATLMGALLKEYAAHGGREFVKGMGKDERNARNGVRKNLREFLCQQFGFSYSDNPIGEEAKDVYRTAFSISFTDAGSDFLQPSRQAARRRMPPDR